MNMKRRSKKQHENEEEKYEEFPEFTKKFMDEVIERLRKKPVREVYENYEHKVPLSLLYLWRAEERKKHTLEWYFFLYILILSKSE